MKREASQGTLGFEPTLRHFSGRSAVRRTRHWIMLSYARIAERCRPDQQHANYFQRVAKGIHPLELVKALENQDNAGFEIKCLDM